MSFNRAWIVDGHTIRVKLSYLDGGAIVCEAECLQCEINLVVEGRPLQKVQRALAVKHRNLKRK